MVNVWTQLEEAKRSRPQIFPVQGFAHASPKVRGSCLEKGRDDTTEKIPSIQCAGTPLGEVHGPRLGADCGVGGNTSL